jgi:sialic acid synthase SpsE
MGSLAAVVGVSLGACVVEKHFCLSREVKNPDSEFSMEPDEFASMVRDIKDAVTIKGHVNYDLTAAETKSVVFRRSLFACADIKCGQIFTLENIRSVRPANGLRPKEMFRVLGKIACLDIAYGTPISEDMYDG